MDKSAMCMLHAYRTLIPGKMLVDVELASLATDWSAKVFFFFFSLSLAPSLSLAFSSFVSRLRNYRLVQCVVTKIENLKK